MTRGNHQTHHYSAGSTCSGSNGSQHVLLSETRQRTKTDYDVHHSGSSTGVWLKLYLCQNGRTDRQTDDK